MASPGSSTIIIVAGGDPVRREHLAGAPVGAFVIAADSGVDRAHALGLRVDLAVGDFDSVSAAGLARAVEDGAGVERHDREKDASDLELALDAAVQRGARRVHVLGGDGGRRDHLLAGALLLAAPRYAALEVVAQVGAARLTVIRHDTTLTGAVGSLVSLLAVHGAATGVTTRGLRYALADDDLLPGSTRGISNELTSEAARVTLRGGVVLAVQPDHRNDPTREDLV